MNNSVAKISGKDFPFNRFVDNEGYARAGFIFSLLDLFGKLEQVMLKVNFEFQLVAGVFRLFLRAL